MIDPPDPRPALIVGGVLIGHMILLAALCEFFRGCQ